MNNITTIHALKKFSSLAESFFINKKRLLVSDGKVLAMREYDEHLQSTVADYEIPRIKTDTRTPGAVTSSFNDYLKLDSDKLDNINFVLDNEKFNNNYESVGRYNIKALKKLLESLLESGQSTVDLKVRYQQGRNADLCMLKLESQNDKVLECSIMMSSK